MNQKGIITGVIIAVVIVIGGLLWWQSGSTNINQTPSNNNGSVVENTANIGNQNTNTNAEVKEFTMTSFYELVDNQPKPQFSLKEITVKKGDRVRIKVTNTRGDHDFKVDEYDIYEPTPLNQEVVIEFTADKAGEFVYYCAKPNHRALGQWGTLRVTE